MIIGLYSNGSRAGKDSVAGFLVQDFGFEQRNLANPIREMLLRLNPILDDDNHKPVTMQYAHDQAAGDWDYIKKHYPESVDWMINLGQAARDIIGEDVWLAPALRNLPEKLVIADVRQPNEYRKIKELGGQVWKVHRQGINKRGMDGLLEGYDFDVHIENRGSLEDLRGVVQATISSQIHGKYVQRNSF